MPFLLHLETSTRMCSVALSENGVLLALKELGEEYTHAENLTLFIEEVFNRTGRHLGELDAVCVSKGPGSYTGLRIGVSTAKGLCYALGVPLIAVGTLESMMQGLISSGLKEFSGISNFCPMLDARRVEVYCAVFNASGTEEEAVSARIIDEHSFQDLLEKGRVVFFGEGSVKCRPIITHPNAVFVDNILPSAKNLVALSEKAFERKQFEDVAYFEPFYLKDFYTGPK